VKEAGGADLRLLAQSESVVGSDEIARLDLASTELSSGSIPPLSSDAARLGALAAARARPPQALQ
jgi:hypothetical protein